MSFPTEGGCLCRAVRYRLSAAPLASMHCHCDNCRKASGAAMLTWLTVNEADVEWLGVEPQRHVFARGRVRWLHTDDGLPSFEATPRNKG